MSGIDANLASGQNGFGAFWFGRNKYMRPLNTIWLWKFFAIQIMFSGSPIVDFVLLMISAKLDASREQIQFPAKSGMQKPR
jgi:hypothetical protein